MTSRIIIEQTSMLSYILRLEVDRLNHCIYLRQVKRLRLEVDSLNDSYLSSLFALMNMMTLSSTLRWVMCCLSSSLTHFQFTYQYITRTSTSAHTFHDELVQVTVDIQAFLRIPGMPTFYEFLLKK